MGGLEDAIVRIVTEGSREAILTLGWLLYLVERYHVGPRREKDFREDIAIFRKDYDDLAEKVASTLGSFSVILEVVKDRINRTGGSGQ